MSKTSPSILVVDHNPEARQLFSVILRKEGYEILEASTGWQALEITQKKRPALVLMDVALPDLDGRELCRQIKADHDLRDVFVIICSDEALAGADKIIGVENGPDEYIATPVSANELLARVRTLLCLRETITTLRASEEYHYRLIDTLPNAVCLIDAEGRLLAANARAAAIFGHAVAGELLQKKIFALAVKGDEERIKADIAGAWKAGGFQNVEYTLLKKNGSRFKAELSATLSLNNNGQPVGLVAAIHDINKRERELDALRKSEEIFRQMADNIREDVFWMNDITTRKLIYVSPSYEEIWGKSLKSIYDSPDSWAESVHPEERERITGSALERQMAGQFNEVFRIVRPDHSIRWIHSRAFPIRDDTGKVYRVVGLAEDITNRKEAWDALGQSEARKSAIMRVALDGIATIDHAGRILELNSAAEKMFSSNRDRLTGKQIMELIPPSLRSWFQDGLVNCFDGKKGPPIGSRIEMAALRTDGGEFPAEFTITQIQISGRPTFAVNIRDITHRKRAQEQLRELPQRIIEAQEMERERVARELHDGINQIIASVKMRLGKVVDSLPELKPAAREILARCDRLLVKALEENRRIAHNLHPADLDNLGLSAACRNFCTEFESRSDLKLELDYQIRQRLPHSIELNLFRIMQEAVNNAEKYAQAKTVKLQFTLQAGALLLKIQDDGCGFDPRKSRSGKKNGHGLGLANMRERAMAMGGTCEVLSTPGKGTAISVTIPHAKQEALNAPPTAPRNKRKPKKVNEPNPAASRMVQATPVSTQLTA